MALAKWNEAYACVIKCRKKKTQHKRQMYCKGRGRGRGRGKVQDRGVATLTTIRGGSI